MFDKLRMNAVRAMNVRNHNPSKDELEVRPNPDPFVANHQVVDKCHPEGIAVIFEGSKPQCEAFLKGLAYGARAAHADFAAAF